MWARSGLDWLDGLDWLEANIHNHCTRERMVCNHLYGLVQLGKFGSQGRVWAGSPALPGYAPPLNERQRALSLVQRYRDANPVRVGASGWWCCWWCCSSAAAPTWSSWTGTPPHMFPFPLRGARLARSGAPRKKLYVARPCLLPRARRLQLADRTSPAAALAPPSPPPAGHAGRAGALGLRCAGLLRQPHGPVAALRVRAARPRLYARRAAQRARRAPPAQRRGAQPPERGRGWREWPRVRGRAHAVRSCVLAPATAPCNVAGTTCMHACAVGVARSAVDGVAPRRAAPPTRRSSRTSFMLGTTRRSMGGTAAAAWPAPDCTREPAAYVLRPLLELRALKVRPRASDQQQGPAVPPS
jgi:hypothetical protein